VSKNKIPGEEEDDDDTNIPWNLRSIRYSLEQVFPLIMLSHVKKPCTISQMTGTFSYVCYVFGFYGTQCRFFTHTLQRYDMICVCKLFSWYPISFLDML